MDIILLLLLVFYPFFLASTKGKMFTRKEGAWKKPFCLFTRKCKIAAELDRYEKEEERERGIVMKKEDNNEIKTDKYANNISIVVEMTNKFA